MRSGPVGSSTLRRRLCTAVLCSCALLLPTCGRGDATSPSGTKPRPNIILLTVDTLRADHLELYGYDRQTMPTISALAESAVVFDQAVVPRGSTRPSYASMLTGLYPFRHGVRSNGTVLHDDLLTLPEILRRAGYHTAAFVSNFVLVGELSGCDQGFDIYDDRLEDREINRPNYERTARGTLQAILEWLAGDPPQPFLLFTNFMDPHGPYHPPARFREMFRSDRQRLLEAQEIPRYQRIGDERNFYDYLDRYDAEIRYVDEALRILIDELRRRGLWDESLVIFTADHGESLGEHGVYFEHHLYVYEETVRVPLLIRFPQVTDPPGAWRPRRVSSLCSPLDLMPTILAFLGLEPEQPLDGRNLLPVLAGEEQPERLIFLEFPSVATPGGKLPDMFAVRSAGQKLICIVDPDSGRLLWQQFYDIQADPNEQQGRAVNPDVPGEQRLARELDALVAEARGYRLPFVVTEYEMPIPQRRGFLQKRRPTSRRVVRPLTAEQIERLRALGYID